MRYKIMLPNAKMLMNTSDNVPPLSHSSSSTFSHRYGEAAMKHPVPLGLKLLCTVTTVQSVNGKTNAARWIHFSIHLKLSCLKLFLIAKKE